MSASDNASTFAKGLAVLDCFEGGRTDLTMAEIARLTGFDRAVARRLCLTLEASGYVVRRNKVLSLTPKVVAVAGGYLTSKRIGRLVQPTLNQFAELLDSEISLAVREGTRAIYVARSEVSAARLSMGFSVGSTLPLLPTAVGRMLLAACAGPERDALIDACSVVKYTQDTKLDAASIRSEIEQAAMQGFAFSNNEFELGAAGVAVPTPDVVGTPSVLATSATANHFARPGELDRVVDILRKAAMTLRA